MRLYILQRILNYVFLILLVNCKGDSYVFEKAVENIYNDEIKNIDIEYPFPGSKYPINFRAFEIKWKDPLEDNDFWLLGYKVDNENYFLGKTNKENFSVFSKKWELMKKRIASNKSVLIVIGIKEKKLRSKGLVDITVSGDKIDSTLIYREVPIPVTKLYNYEIYRDVENDLHNPGLLRPNSYTSYVKQISITAIDLQNRRNSKIIFDNQQSCWSCHRVYNNGEIFSITIRQLNNYKTYYSKLENKKYKLTEENSIYLSKFLDENQLKNLGVNPDGHPMQRLSPDGKYILIMIAGGGEFYQTLSSEIQKYPFYLYQLNGGFLALYSIEQNNIKFYPLEGRKYGYLNVEWHPNGKEIIFERVKSFNKRGGNLYLDNIESQRLKKITEFKDIKLDLYTLKVENGEFVGIPQPLEGASKNGLNNYWPRYSPDGRWIVFTTSKVGHYYVQPDSQLYIIPSQGGKARKLKSNNPDTMNSWHSWSSNGSWLVFSTKHKSNYTQFFITHIDESGNDSSPIILSNIVREGFVANIPEFININFNQINKIEVIED